MWLQHAKVLFGREVRPAGSATSKAVRRAGRWRARPCCENLEGRQLLSNITATLNTTSYPADGPIGHLMVTGTSGNDNIHITESSGNLSISGISIAWTESVKIGRTPRVETVTVSSIPASDVTQIVVSTGSGNDTVRIDPGVTTSALVFAGNGTDMLITGGSNDELWAGTGSDTLIALGGSGNSLVGGTGTDSFWYDKGASVLGVTTAEQNAGMVHNIGAAGGFATLDFGSSQGKVTTFTPNDLLNGQNIPNPTPSVAGTAEDNFGSDPLFASGGPSPADVTQGGIGDCQTLAAAIGVATKDPQLISNMMVSLGDGTYAVQLVRNGAHEYFRVNADLPVNAKGSLVYAQLGQQSSLWVALLEKVWTFARPTTGTWWNDNVGTYNNISGGAPGELLGMLGATVTWNTTNLWNEVVSDVAAGKIVCVGTAANPTASSGLVGAHEYYVDHVNYVTITQPFGLPPIKIPISITLRNPWGGSNPFVTITATDISTSVADSTAATF